jgi:hypothetical protein
MGNWTERVRCILWIIAIELAFLIAVVYKIAWKYLAV